MLRALTVAFAMLAVGAGACSAQVTPQASDSSNQNSVCNEASNGQSFPQTNLAAGSSSSLGEGEDSAAENELLEAANRSRKAAGVPPLRGEESLREAARAHARRMVKDELLEHQLSGELPLLDRIALVSRLQMDRAGENIAYAGCATSANGVLMRSAPHRRNLLDRGFNVAGIAAIWSKGRFYVVQDFAHELPSYSAAQSEDLVGQAVGEIRQQAGLPALVRLTPPKLDEAACRLASEDRPNARLLATAYDNRKIIAYTESRPEVLPSGALQLLRDPGVRQFAVGSCYARNAAYPTGMYWVAILLY